MTGGFCVCVPARNEAGHIATLIAALGDQTVDRTVPLALCVNNTDDDTIEVARSAALRTRSRVKLIVLECIFDDADAHAGSARRAAMGLGADHLADETDLLISTDADCRPPPTWVVANLAHSGLDRVLGGRIELDEEHPVAPSVAALRVRFDRYWQDVRAIEDAIDPLPWDPSPRHGDHTGASLALPVALYRRAGGVPLLETGEDCALVEAAVAVGGKLVHPTAIWTRASPRTEGRARDGMALDMQRWLGAAANGEQPRVPAFEHWRARAAWRRRERALRPDVSPASAERALAPMPYDMPLPEL